MTLYDYTEKALEIYELLASEEIDQETYDAILDGLGTTEKIEQMCKYCDELEAEAEKYKKFAEKTRKRGQIKENAAKRIKKSLLDHMEATGEKRKEAGKFILTTRSIASTEIVDINQIPDEYLRIKPAEADKMAIKRVLLTGKEVEGAAIKYTNSLTIR